MKIVRTSFVKFQNIFFCQVTRKSNNFFLWDTLTCRQARIAHELERGLKKFVHKMFLDHEEFFKLISKTTEINLKSLTFSTDFHSAEGTIILFLNNLSKILVILRWLFPYLLRNYLICLRLFRTVSLQSISNINYFWSIMSNLTDCWHNSLNIVWDWTKKVTRKMQ